MNDFGRKKDIRGYKWVFSAPSFGCPLECYPKPQRNGVGATNTRSNVGLHILQLPRSLFGCFVLVAAWSATGSFNIFRANTHAIWWQNKPTGFRLTSYTDRECVCAHACVVDNYIVPSTCSGKFDKKKGCQFINENIKSSDFVNENTNNNKNSVDCWLIGTRSNTQTQTGDNLI